MRNMSSLLWQTDSEHVAGSTNAPEPAAVVLESSQGGAPSPESAYAAIVKQASPAITASRMGRGCAAVAVFEARG